MKVMTATEVARNFNRVLDKVERDQEDVVLVRKHRRVARLIPEPPTQNALEVLGDLYGTLDDETAEALCAAIKLGRGAKKATLGGMRNPWVS